MEKSGNEVKIYAFGQKLDLAHLYIATCTRTYWVRKRNAMLTDFMWSHKLTDVED